MSQYLRRVEVSVGQPGQQGVLISGLKTTFRVTRTIEREPNKAEIEIHNLDRDTQREFRREGAVVRVVAGYGDDLRSLFIGDIDIAVATSRGTDIVLRVEAQDGARRFRDGQITESFRRGVLLRDVYRSIARALDLPLGAQSQIPNRVLASGLVVSGPIASALDTITRSTGLRWSIQDGELQILADSESTQESVPLITPQTGLVGQPEQTADGVVVTMLLDGRLRPGTRFRLDSGELSGVYRCEDVEHVGDSYSEQQYYTKVNATVSQ